MKTTTIVLVAALAASAWAHAAPWRLFQCTGTQGEAVYSDRWSGTECRELWVDPERHDETGTLITVGRVNRAEAKASGTPTVDFSETPDVAQPGTL